MYIQVRAWVQGMHMYVHTSTCLGTGCAYVHTSICWGTEWAYILQTSTCLGTECAYGRTYRALSTLRIPEVGSKADEEDHWGQSTACPLIKLHRTVVARFEAGWSISRDGSHAHESVWIVLRIVLVDLLIRYWS
jgi:hypothetical protein